MLIQGDNSHEYGAEAWRIIADYNELDLRDGVKMHTVGLLAGATEIFDVRFAGTMTSDLARLQRSTSGQDNANAYRENLYAQSIKLKELLKLYFE